MEMGLILIGKNKNTMKRFALYFGITAALMASCSIQDKEFVSPQQDDIVFFASFEQPSEINTKVYANEDLYLRWTADDRVSIFNKNTYNQQYKFLGETGDNSGEFAKVEGAEFVTGNSLADVVSVYPYQESTKITEDGTLTVILPAEQHFVKNTFGLKANTMVSVSADNFLQYKNVGGYLRVSLYGSGVSVSSITLKGNNGERLAGKASITMPLDGIPSAVMADDATTEITLVCDTPVKLGETPEESTQFWFVVPPVTFSKGFSISVTQANSCDYEKNTVKSITIERSKLSKMSPIEIEKITQPNNVIYYTSSDGAVVTPYSIGYTAAKEVFGANIVSNEYVGGRGIITFDGDITSIGGGAFFSLNSLTSIKIPNSVTSIGYDAFLACSGLTSIDIPDSVVSIGNSAFSATGLTSIKIPDSVTSIGSYAFDSCKSLTSIVIPESVTDIGINPFSSCSELTSISVDSGNLVYDSRNNCNAIIRTQTNELISGSKRTVIPNSVAIIGNKAFSYCESLTSIVIPNSVTEIGSYAFNGCTGLQGISIPESVTSIGSYAFSGCQSVTTVFIPKSVTNIGIGALSSCSSLNSIVVALDNTMYDSRGNCNGIIETSTNTLISGCKNTLIPNSVEALGQSAFLGHSGMTSIVIPTNVMSIGAFAFTACSGLTSIEIPENVTSIGGSAFLSCVKLTYIYVRAIAPPTLAGYNTFTATNNCSIYVPTGSVDAYKSVWSEYADRIQSIPSAPIPEAVDLGLPSGLKWASFNLGATRPEEFGDYYAWGEITPYYIGLDPLTWVNGKESGYSWESYKWCMGSEKTLTKYCTNSEYGYNAFSDGKTVLDPEDDAAHVALGGKWRMPTETELTELKTVCSWWITSINGIAGVMFYGPNGNTIFLPGGMAFNGTTRQDGSRGAYWSSSLSTRFQKSASFLYFYSRQSQEIVNVSSSERHQGFSVRPVCD